MSSVSEQASGPIRTVLNHSAPAAHEEDKDRPRTQSCQGGDVKKGGDRGRSGGGELRQEKGERGIGADELERSGMKKKKWIGDVEEGCGSGGDEKMERKAV